VDVKRNQLYYLEHKDEIKARSAAWYAANWERGKASRRAYGAKHRVTKMIYDKKHNRRKTLGRHNLTVEDYQQMFSEQGGLCAICGNPPGERALCVDHDHVTGKVRGLLCDACNRALGVFQDDVALLLAATKYLESFS
jgi:hypothetical protein